MTYYNLFLLFPMQYCCHSGHLDTANIGNNIILSEGMTILTSSTADQYATEANGHGLFTNLLVDALNGGAANILGHYPRKRICIY